MATVFQVTYPSGVTGTVTATNPSVGSNGSPAPTSSTEIGVIDTTTGFLTPLTGTSVGGNEALNVNITGSVIPAGGATAANQTNGDQKTQIVDSLGNVIASTANSLDVAVTQPLPTGTNSIGQVTANAGTGTFIVDGSGSTQPVSGTVTANIGTTGGLALDTTVSGLLTDTQLRATPVPVTGPLTDTQLRATPVPVSGTVTTTNSANGATGAAVPTDATQVGGSDGTNLIAIKVSATGVVSVDGSATTQPVSGTVTANQGTSPWVTSGTSTVSGTVTANIGTTGGLALDTTVSGLLTDTQLRATPLPVSGTVAATQSGTWTVQPGNTANTTPWLATINQGGNSATVSAGGALTVDGSAVTQPVSGTVTANIGTTNGLALNTSVLGLQVAQGSTTSGQSGGLDLGAVTTAAPTYTTGQSSPLSLDTAGNLRVTGGGVTQGSTTSGQNGTLIQGAVTTAAPTYTTAQTSPLSLTTGGALRVEATAGTGTFSTKETTSATATLSNVSGSASSVSLLASNANRLGATFFNDSTATLYLKFGATASTTSYTVQLQSNDYYELPTPHLYTGAIDGIWSAANGAVRITELS